MYVLVGKILPEPQILLGGGKVGGYHVPVCTLAHAHGGGLYKGGTLFKAQPDKVYSAPHIYILDYGAVGEMLYHRRTVYHRVKLYALKSACKVFVRHIPLGHEYARAQKLRYVLVKIVKVHPDDALCGAELPLAAQQQVYEPGLVLYKLVEYVDPKVSGAACEQDVAYVTAFAVFEGINVVPRKELVYGGVVIACDVIILPGLRGAAPLCKGGKQFRCGVVEHIRKGDGISCLARLYDHVGDQQ